MMEAEIVSLIIQYAPEVAPYFILIYFLIDKYKTGKIMTSNNGELKKAVENNTKTIHRLEMWLAGRGYK